MSRFLLRLMCVLAAAAFAFTLLPGCERNEVAPDAKMPALVRADIDEVMADIDEDQSGVKMSSNPYDYVGISPAFARLVDRGPAALDAIAAEIERSGENGLREYLLAIAGNTILGGDEMIGIETGQGWAERHRSQR